MCRVSGVPAVNCSCCISLPGVWLVALDNALIGREIEESFGFYDMSGGHPEYPHKLVSIRLARSSRGGSSEADDHAIAIADHEMNPWNERRCKPTYQRLSRVFREFAQTLV